MLCCLKYPICLRQDQPQWLGAGWIERGHKCACDCFLLINGDCQASVSHPTSEINESVHLPFRTFFLSFWGCRLLALQDNTGCCIFPGAHCYLWECVRRWVLRGWRDVSRLHDSAFCLAMAAARIQLSHFCISSLSWSLSSAVVYADHSGRDYWECIMELIFSLSLSPIRISRLSPWYSSLLLSLSSSLAWLTHPPSDALMCKSFRHICVLGWESSVGL